MSKTADATVRNRLERFERPVLVASGGGNVGHIPDGGRPACNHTANAWRVEALRQFKRRRNPSICELCQERLGVEGYPEEATPAHG